MEGCYQSILGFQNISVGAENEAPVVNVVIIKFLETILTIIDGYE